MSLLQTSSVHDYHRQFEMLSAPLRGLPSSVLEAAFINGLRPDIQVELRQLESVGLLGKMRAAQKIEDKQLALRVYQDGHMQCWPKPTRLDIFASARECDDSCPSSHAPSTTCSFNHQLTITPHFPTRTRRLPHKDTTHTTPPWMDLSS